MGSEWRTVKGVVAGLACARVVKVQLSFFLPKEMTMTGLNLAKR
jgi:hypothetical protein